MVKSVEAGFYIYFKELGKYLLFLNKGDNVHLNSLVFSKNETGMRLKSVDGDLTLRTIYRTVDDYYLWVRFGYFDDFYIDVSTDGSVFVNGRYLKSRHEAALFTKKKLFFSISERK